MNWEENVKMPDDLTPSQQQLYEQIKPYLEAQAKLTWDIAEKAGIKKVVDWIPPEQYKINIQQAKAEVAREIFEILEEAFRNADNRMGLFILSREWQSLKDKFLKEASPSD